MLFVAAFNRNSWNKSEGPRLSFINHFKVPAFKIVFAFGPTLKLFRMKNASDFFDYHFAVVGKDLSFPIYCFLSELKRKFVILYAFKNDQNILEMLLLTGDSYNILSIW